MSKKKKIEVGTVQIDQALAMRKVSRDKFGHLPTTSVPDKKRKQAHSRKPKHRRDFRDERSAGFLFIGED